MAKKMKDNYITLTIMKAMTPMTIRKSNVIIHLSQSKHKYNLSFQDIENL